MAKRDPLAIDCDLRQIAELRKLLSSLARLLVVVAGHSEDLLASNLTA
jgi:hypothetical protein